MSLISGKFHKWQQELPKKLLIILTALMILNFFGYIDKSLEFLGKSYIDEYNKVYIESVEKQSLKSFVAISVTLSTLAILKSSTAGFSFIFDLNIQYGNLFQSLYLLVEKGWNASFIALATIEVIKLFVNYSYSLASIFLFGFIICDISRLLLSQINQRTYEILYSLRKIFLFLTLMTYVLIPIYVMFMGVVSQNISQPLNQEISQKLEVINKELMPKTPDQITKDSKEYSKDIVKSFSKIKDKMLDASRILIKHSIAAIITAIFIPLTFLLFLFLSFKVIFRKAS